MNVMCIRCDAEIQDGEAVPWRGEDHTADHSQYAHGEAWPVCAACSKHLTQRGLYARKPKEGGGE